MLKFYLYDKICAESEVDYPLEAGFTRVYTATVDITFKFPNQILLSIKDPDIFKSLDHYTNDNLDHTLDFPSKTYAYTTMTPLIVTYDRLVSFEYFWIRAHRSP